MEVAKQDFDLTDLATQSVTLFPSRARVVRSLDAVQLKPGQNEVQIYGLTPTVDEHSIQVYGTGAAVITDFTVELVPNRKVFEDVYPEFDQDDDDINELFDGPIEVEDCDEVKKLTKELDALEDQLARHKEVINSSARQLDTLDIYTRSLSAAKNGAEEVEKTVAMYERERARVFDMHCKAAIQLKHTTEKIEEKEKAKAKASIGDRRRHEKRLRARNKDLLRKQAQKFKREEVNKRLKEEKLKFWPKKVFVVTVNLEVPLYTPTSSRRNSIDSVTLAPSINENAKGKDDAVSSEDGIQISLSLAYVTTAGSWAPRYDINIDSIKKNASITYRAELVNETSEVWKDMQLVLSTSQTSYSGIDDKIPFLSPWHVKLNKHMGQELLSTEEMNYQRPGNLNRGQANRGELFGADLKRRSEFKSMKAKGGFVAQKPAANVRSSDLASFGSAAPGGQALFGSSFGGTFRSASAIPPPPPMALGSRVSEAAEESVDEDGDMGFGLFDDGGPAISQKKALDYQESQWGDQGLTSTYEVPGARSLLPSSVARRHKIASLQAINIALSHVLIAKLRPAAFLRAKIRNPSASVTLLKGTAGITLDGSFIGNTALSRVGPGALFELSLGVDPAVQVNYPKPTMQRSTGGIFNKELTQVFSRNIWITNSKIVPIELTVLDQYPVSQDERLNIHYLQPKGLSKEGDVVRAGVAAKESASGASETSKNNTWGKATATLRANGQVSWTVNLEKKQACLLKLEYEAKMPAAERITQA